MSNSRACLSTEVSAHPYHHNSPRFFTVVSRTHDSSISLSSSPPVSCPCIPPYCCCSSSLQSTLHVPRTGLFTIATVVLQRSASTRPLLHSMWLKEWSILLILSSGMIPLTGLWVSIRGGQRSTYIGDNGEEKNRGRTHHMDL